jgi:nuclear transport factor 2 (NTF2) superfamily protein
VRFAYEWHDHAGNWFRSYGNENWEFDEDGYMSARHASINDLPISESERKFRWPQGRRPDDHPRSVRTGAVEQRHERQFWGRRRKAPKQVIYFV